mgnify:CR=1 FL=1
MKKVFDAIKLVLRFHKKKILFLFGSIAFCFVVLFPYDDLSDLITQKISVATSNNVYIQFDQLSFGLLPQLGLKMSNVVVESIFAPTLAVKTLGFAPSITSLLFKTPGGKLKAYGLFGGDAVVSIGRSNELDINTTEYGIDVEIEDIDLKQLTKFLKSSYNLPMTASGSSQIESSLHLDPSFKEQPKGDFEIELKDVKIPSFILTFNMPTEGGMGVPINFPMPALTVSKITLNGKIDDRKLIIKEGKIGDPKNDLHGEISGEFIVDIKKGFQVNRGGYDLKINLNVSDNLKRQLGTVLTFVDLYNSIGEKYKFDSLKGVRYSMRLSSRNANSPPRVSSY